MDANKRIEQKGCGMKLDTLRLSEALKTAFKTIEEAGSQNDLNEFKKCPEDKLSRYHHGLGRYLRNTLGLWNEKSDIKKYFNDELGILHPDDMSGIILVSFHRHINDKPLELEKQAQFYKDYWKKKENVPV